MSGPGLTEARSHKDLDSQPGPRGHAASCGCLAYSHQLPRAGSEGLRAWCWELREINRLFVAP